MADQTVSFTGQRNLSGPQRALFQELFAGEVIRTYKERNIMMDKVKTKVLKNGKSFAFPMVGRATASYHTPGELIIGQQIAHSKRTVTVDGLMIAPVFLDSLDEALNHYEVRAPYSEECGHRLATITDKNILRVAVNAARITDAASAQAAGLVPFIDETYTPNVILPKYTAGVESGNATTDDEVTGRSIYQAVLRAKETFEVNDIMTENLKLYLHPTEYYKLLNAPNVQELVWMNSDVNGEGSAATGMVPKIAGIPIYKTNHLPRTDESSGISDPEWSARSHVYRGDFSKVRGLLMLPEAVACVRVFDIATESEYQIDRQGWFLVAKQALGVNYLEVGKAITLELGDAPYATGVGLDKSTMSLTTT